jgi:hypothetical protein
VIESPSATITYGGATAEAGAAPKNSWSTGTNPAVNSQFQRIEAIDPGRDPVAITTPSPAPGRVPTGGRIPAIQSTWFRRRRTLPLNRIRAT